MIKFCGILIKISLINVFKPCIRKNFRWIIYFDVWTLTVFITWILVDILILNMIFKKVNSTFWFPLVIMKNVVVDSVIISIVILRNIYTLFLLRRVLILILDLIKIKLKSGLLLRSFFHYHFQLFFFFKFRSQDLLLLWGKSQFRQTASCKIIVFLFNQIKIFFRLQLYNFVIKFLNIGKFVVWFDISLFLWIESSSDTFTVLNCIQLNRKILFDFAISCLVVGVHVFSSAYTLKLQLLIFFHQQLILTYLTVNSFHFILLARMIPWVFRSFALFIRKSIAASLILLLYLNLKHLGGTDNISANVFIEFSLRSLNK